MQDSKFVDHMNGMCQRMSEIKRELGAPQSPVQCTVDRQTYTLSPALCNIFHLFICLHTHDAVLVVGQQRSLTEFLHIHIRSKGNNGIVCVAAA
jgi:hypothetical protein